MDKKNNTSIDYKVIFPFGYQQKTDKEIPPIPDVIAEHDPVNKIYIFKSAQRAFEKTALENYQS